MINKKNNKGFTLAEMMIVMVIISLVLVGAAPIITTRRTISNKTPWQWAGNNSDIYFGHGNTQTAVLGQSSSVTAPNTRLYINTLENELPLLYYTKSNGSSPRSITGSLLMTDKNLVLSNTLSSDAHENNIYIGKTTIANGDNNIAIGYNALFKGGTSGNWDGVSNSVAIGYSALKNLQCNNCTALGKNTLYSAFYNPGEFDTAIGDDIEVNDGSYNTSIGKNIYNSYNNNTLLGNIPNASGYHNVIIRTATDTQTTNQKTYRIGENTIQNSVIMGSYDWGTGTGLSYGEGVRRSVLIGQPTPAGYYSTYDTIAIGNYADAKTLKQHSLSSSDNISIGGYANGIYKTGSASNYSIYPGFYNTSIGIRAGAIEYNSEKTASNTFSRNVNIGARAGLIALGSVNTARTYTKNVNIGYEAGLNNYGNASAEDYPAGYGQENINIGSSAGKVLAGYKNVAIGYNAGQIWRSQYNTFIGYKAGNNSWGEKLTFIGSESDKHDNHCPWSSDCSGVNANSVFIGKTNLYNNTPSGNNPKASYDYIYIPGMLYVLKNTEFMTDNYVGENSSDLGSNSSGLHASYTDWVTVHNKDFSTKYSSGYVMDNSYFIKPSDIRLKDVKGENKDGLAKIRKLKVYNYTFKNDKANTPHVGVIAQDLQKIFPNAVTKDKDGYLLIRKEDMFYALINAVKEIDQKVKFAISQLKDMFAKVAQIDLKIKNLEQSNDEITAQIADIDKRIEALEK